MKKRYRSENAFEDPGINGMSYKQYENLYPPSPAMSTSSYQDELQDIDAPWQQQQRGMLSIKRSSRTSSPQGQLVADLVSGFCKFSMAYLFVNILFKIFSMSIFTYDIIFLLT